VAVARITTPKPLDSYPKPSVFALPAWLALNLPGGLPWPDRWLPTAAESAIVGRERATLRPALAGGWKNPCPVPRPWPHR
jgi:hypothetical protein